MRQVLKEVHLDVKALPVGKALQHIGNKHAICGLINLGRLACVDLGTGGLGTSSPGTVGVHNAVLRDANQPTAQRAFVGIEAVAAPPCRQEDFLGGIGGVGVSEGTAAQRVHERAVLVVGLFERRLVTGNEALAECHGYVGHDSETVARVGAMLARSLTGSEVSQERSVAHVE